VAWHSLGWTPVAFSEIESFPAAVLAHHYPKVPNLGDMTKYEEWPDEPINLLVGGTPCQSFSVAGLRKGLADPRGNLMLTYGAIARRYRPEWLVWENVPGVLSSNGGRDFGIFLGMLAELGYGFAYRVLDAQYFGVAQRRRRVFVVANARSWQRAAAVLFESHSLQGHPAPSREAKKDVAGTFTARANSGGWSQDVDLAAGGYMQVAQCLTAGTGLRFDPETETLPVAFNWQSGGDARGLDPKDTAQLQVCQVPAVVQPTYGIPGNWIGRAPENGGNAVEPMLDVAPCQTKTDVHAVAQPIPYDFLQITAPVNRQSRKPGDPCHTLARDNAAHATIMQAVASDQTAGTLRANPGSGWRSNGTPVEGVAIQAMQVRRLTPTECERLQGFPDGYTNIPWRKKPESPDGPRYKALGNSMAVPVMRWIGERIQVSHVGGKKQKDG